jgi:GT2 family glycosyltransferase
VRRDVVSSVGVLDERFRIHFNDVDWCWRIHRAGWKLFFVSEVEVMHHLSVTTRKENEDFQLQSELMRNTFDYFHKHFGRAGLWWVRFWMVVGYGFRQILYSVPQVAGSDWIERCSLEFLRGAFRAAWSGDPEVFGQQRGLPPHRTSGVSG